MKKLLLIALLPTCAVLHAAPWDLNAQQYDQFGTSMINRLMPLPAGSANGMYMYDAGLNLPKIGTVDSTMAWYSGQVMGLSATKNAEIAGKMTIPTGTTAQYIRGDGSLATLPTAPASPSQSSQSRSLNSAFQISSTRAAMVFYSVRIVTTASIGGNQDGDVILEIASDSGFTTNVQTLSITQNAQAISLAIVLNSVQTQTGVLSGFVPAGYYTRLRTVNTTGTPTYTYRSGQEVLM